jgi:hypothetical protein
MSTIHPVIDSSWEHVFYPKEVSDEKLFNNQLFKKLVAICSTQFDVKKVHSFAAKKSLIRAKPKRNEVEVPVKMLERLQELIGSNVSHYDAKDVLLCKKLAKHLSLNCQFPSSILDSKNQVKVRSVLKSIGHLIADVAVVFKNPDLLDKCLPSYTAKVLETGLECFVERDGLIYGQYVLIDDEIEVLSHKLLKGREQLREEEESDSDLDDLKRACREALGTPFKREDLSCDGDWEMVNGDEGRDSPQSVSSVASSVHSVSEED